MRAGRNNSLKIYISNDDVGRLSSGSECDDDDADCDEAADPHCRDSNVIALTR